MNKLILTEENGKFNLHTEAPIDFQNLAQMLLTAMLAACKSMLDVAEANYDKNEDLQKKVDKETFLAHFKGDIYDMINFGVTNMLGEFAPEIENHPDLTAQAIMEAENAILDKVAKEDDTDEADDAE